MPEAERTGVGSEADREVDSLAYFMYQWAQETWRGYREDGLEGSPIDAIAGNRLAGLGIARDDVVYIVGQEEGRLLLIGKLTVADGVVDRASAERALGRGAYPDARDHVLAAEPKTSMRFDREVPEADARAIESTDGTPIHIDPSEYRLDPQALRTARQLTPVSAQIFERLLDQSFGQSPEVEDLEDAVAEAAGRPRPRRARVSAAARRGIERRAVDVASALYAREGWEVEDVGDVESYDLHCTREDEERRVEVKGSTGRVPKVALTANEVEHARHHASTVALVWVSGIALDETGPEPLAGGGTPLVLDPWNIEAGELRPVAFEYELPGG